MSVLTVTREPGTGQQRTERPPVAGDVLTEADKPFTVVEYVNSTREVAGRVLTCCGVSWATEVSEIHPTGRGGTTITVRSPAP